MLCLSGGDGNGSGPLSTLLLLKVFGPLSDGEHSHGVRHTRLEDRRGAAKDKGCDKCVPSHQTNPITKVSLLRDCSLDCTQN